jgi:hypothetical protein
MNLIGKSRAQAVNQEGAERQAFPGRSQARCQWRRHIMGLENRIEEGKVGAGPAAERQFTAIGAPCSDGKKVEARLGLSVAAGDASGTALGRL